jgi:hypothetical protein
VSSLLTTEAIAEKPKKEEPMPMPRARMGGMGGILNKNINKKRKTG